VVNFVLFRCYRPVIYNKGNGNITYAVWFALGNHQISQQLTGHRDILALWGLRNRPPWLKGCLTGADVHSVQKRFPKVASSM